MQTYSEMVDSELTYLGMIPRSWRLTPASMLFNENRQNNQPLISQTPLQFKTGNIVRKNIDVDDKLREEIKRYTVVDKNDIMVNGLNLNYDFATQRVALVGERGCITPAYIALRTRKNYLPRYANYLLKALDGQKVLNGWGTGIRLTLNFTEFKKYRLPEPNTETQEKIADFLDTETAQIDNLIAKQERLLELLEEKRRATITHSVTRGLNPSVELKETNIPWLGQIPAHWGFERNKYRLSINKGLNITKADLIEKGVPVISYGQVHSKYPVHFDPKTDILPFVPESYLKIENAIMRKGDFIFADTSEDYEGSGNFSMLKTDSTVLAGYHSIVARLTSEEVVPEYQAYYFASEQHRNQIRARVSGVKVFSISQSIIANAWSLLPPKKKQEDIAQFLDIQEQKTKELKQKIQTQITLLRERRTSLISHAVTGKVRVD